MTGLITFKWTFEHPVNAVWDLPVSTTLMAQQNLPEKVVTIIGPPGGNSTLSADADNQLTIGQDGGLYMGRPTLETAQW